MNKHKKPLTEEEQMTLKLREEDELLRLKRQYNIMVNDKNVYLRASQAGKLQNQRLLMSLRKEKHNLDRNLASAVGLEEKTKETLNHLRCLVREQMDLVAEVTKIKQETQEFDNQIRMVQRNLRKLKRHNLLSEIREEEKMKNRQQNLRNLENRLDLTVKQFCTILAENKETRKVVYSMLRQRQRFNEHCECLLNNLNNGKKAIADLIEQASSAFDQREEYFEKNMILKFRAQTKYEQHVQEMKNMTWEMERQLDLGEFLAQKGRKRLMLDLAKKQQEQREQQRRELEAKLEKYKNIFNDIRLFSKESTIYKIEVQYLKGEEENYALFNYANALNAELETLSAATAESYKKIDEQRQISSGRELKQKATLEELREQINQKQSEICAVKEKSTQQKLHLKQIINGIEVLFKLMQTVESPMLELLGENTQITETNVLLFLSVLETRLTDLIRNVLISNPERYNAKRASRTSDIIYPVSPCPLCYLAKAANEVCVTEILPINLHYIRNCPNVSTGVNFEAKEVTNVS